MPDFCQYEPDFMTEIRNFDMFSGFFIFSGNRIFDILIMTKAVRTDLYRERKTIDLIDGG